MAIQKFSDWMKVKESTAFTRSRNAAALGTGPSIPDAEINSHDTARPWVKDAIEKRNKKDEKKKKKDDDCDLPPA
jgi:TfoX/Sxy family transcriptional regulator of competence genes